MTVVTELIRKNFYCCRCDERGLVTCLKHGIRLVVSSLTLSCVCLCTFNVLKLVTFINLAKVDDIHQMNNLKA